jgi:Ca-activated chloride channel homolog
MEMEDPLFGKRIVSVPTKIDEPMMRTIASLTGGRYYRAQDPKGLEEIYTTIDKLEKTEITSSSYYRYHELFRNLLLLALLFLLLEIGLANTRFMKIP